MIKNIFIILIILILNSCSFDTRSGIWTEEPINLGNEENKEIKVLFKKEILNENEFNPNLKLEIKNFNQNKNKFNGNNFGALEISSSFENISKYSFNRIKYFDHFEPELVFIRNDLIFFDKKGSIIRFDEKSKIKWKVNHYNKKEKKLPPILKIAKVGNKLLITDNLAKLYLLDASNGKLIWKNEHKVFFISQIKVDRDRFYVLDASNIFTCYSLSNGKKYGNLREKQN